MPNVNDTENDAKNTVSHHQFLNFCVFEKLNRYFFSFDVI